MKDSVSSFDSLLKLTRDVPFHIPFKQETTLLEQIKEHRLFCYINDILASQNEIDHQKWKEVLTFWNMKVLNLSVEMARIIKLFQASKIDPLAFKGPSLAYGLYDELSRRHFIDIDILVDRPSIEKAVDILEGQGYQMIKPEIKPTGTNFDDYLKYKKDIKFLNRKKRVAIELHVGFFRHHLLSMTDAEKLLADPAEIKISDVTMKTMNSNNMFIYLVYHGSQHMYSKLYWLRDVAEALKVWDLDQDYILRMVSYLRFERLLTMSLTLAEYYFNAPITGEFREILEKGKKPGVVKKMVKMCHQSIQSQGEASFKSKMRKHIFFLYLKPGLKYKFWVIKSLVQRNRLQKKYGGH